ncbi:U-scoloptoxin(05)-Sm1a [Augochlora pura]
MFSSSRAFPPLFFAALFAYIGLAHGIKCYKCGQYNEGIGSITPCINYTAQMHLRDCAPSFEWCIKYVSEGSIVRDCVPKCVEKEAWSTKTYCCQQDGCNSGPSLTASSTVVFVGVAMAALLVGRTLRG